MPSEPREVKMLKYAIYTLIFILTSITGWSAISITKLPDCYVRLERYKEDRTTSQDSLKRIEQKLDQLIQQKMKER